MDSCWNIIQQLDNSTETHQIMGKLNVSMLRYLSKEDFRVLTAVKLSILYSVFCKHFNATCWTDYLHDKRSRNVLIWQPCPPGPTLTERLLSDKDLHVMTLLWRVKRNNLVRWMQFFQQTWPRNWYLLSLVIKALPSHLPRCLTVGVGHWISAVCLTLTKWFICLIFKYMYRFCVLKTSQMLKK